MVLLPRLGGRGLWREADHGRGYPPGILLYPLAVLALILVFHDEPGAVEFWRGSGYAPDPATERWAKDLTRA